MRAGLGAVLLVTAAAVTVLAAALPEESQAVFGDIRVQALSDRLVRVELRGALGFEDRATFTVVGREQFSGIPIVAREETDTHYVVKTAAYQVLVEKNAGMDPAAVCAAAIPFAALERGVRVEEYPDGVGGLSQDACCAKCQAVSMCTAWQWQPSTGTCFLMQSPAQTQARSCLQRRHSGGHTFHTA